MLPRHWRCVVALHVGHFQQTWLHQVIVRKRGCVVQNYLGGACSKSTWPPFPPFVSHTTCSLVKRNKVETHHATQNLRKNYLLLGVKEILGTMRVVRVVFQRLNKIDKIGWNRTKNKARTCLKATSGCSVLKSELAIKASELPGAEISLSAVRGLGRTAATAGGWWCTTLFRVFFPASPGVWGWRI